MKKNLLAVIMALVLCFSITACGGNEDEEPAKEGTLLENWDLTLSDEEVRDMSNFVVLGNYIVVDDLLYGIFGSDASSGRCFGMAELTDDGSALIGDVKVIEDDTWAAYMTEHDGYIYGTLGDSQVFKVKVGETKIETLYDAPAAYPQVVGDKLYFTDENNYLCSMDFNGKNIETILDKDVYYVYVLPNNTVIYQDDADNESLHIYSLETKEDVKMNDVVSYSPIICGEHIYYLVNAGDESCYFERVNIRTQEVERAPGEIGIYSNFIENNEITFAFAGMPCVPVDEWNKLSEKEYGGEDCRPLYSNGEIRVYELSDHVVMATKDSFQVRETVTRLN